MAEHPRHRGTPFRSGAFRFALVFAAVFALAAFLILGMVRHQIGHYARKAMEGSLTSETATLVAEYPHDLAGEIRLRVAATKGHAFQYLLLDRQGRPIVGGIPQGAAKEGWGSVMMREHPPTANDPEAPERLMTLGTRLADGSLLVVATDGYDVDKVGGHMVHFTILWAIAITLLALASGWFVGRLFLGRLSAVNAAVDRVMAGRLDQRLPAIGLAPELDELSHNLNRMLDRIDGLMEGLRQVTTDIAHDLRTPLTRLRQKLEEAQGAAGQADMSSCIEAALAQADQLLSTFRAILRLAQIEGGARRERFTSVNLSDLIGGLIETYEPVAADAGHCIIAPAPVEATIHGDEELLAQLFANLIENAILHTPAGTRVTITIEATPAAVRVMVMDDGPGVPESERLKIARRFYQVDPSRGSGSAGLGLSIASAVAALHEARLDFDDACPGLRVVVSFPGSGAG